MEGLINAMSNKRPQDTMYALADAGYVNPSTGSQK